MKDETQQIRITPPPTEKRGSWYLLTGLILGLILGLVYTWLINPVIYENTTPSRLVAPHKDTYRSTIAQAFAATGNLDRAALRLELLEDNDPIIFLGAQAQRALAAGNQAEAHALALLASALQPGQPVQIDPLQTEPPAQNPTTPVQGVPTHTLPVPTTSP